MRLPMVVGNWETDMDSIRAVESATDLRKQTAEAYDVEVVVCPPIRSLTAVKEALKGSAIKVGAQDIGHRDSDLDRDGAAATDLSDLCEYVVLGHSRRQQSGDSNDVIREKMAAVCRTPLQPILCVGEKPVEKTAGKSEEAIARRLSGALNGICLGGTHALVVVYEPAWAISERDEVSGRQVNDAAIQIRSTLTDLYNRKAAEAVRVLYGGSVTPDTVSEFIEQSEIDGVFVENAGMDAEEFADIIYLTEYVYFPNNPPIKDLIPW